MYLLFLSMYRINYIYIYIYIAVGQTCASRKSFKLHVIGKKNYQTVNTRVM